MATDQIFDQGINANFTRNMDCRVIGLGINNSVNILCGAGVEYVYVLRFLYSATAVIVFLVCILVVCLINRKDDQP
jgi:hypothetical protein